MTGACGFGDKSCGICANADSNCLCAMHEDFFIPATKEQVEQRIKENRYIISDLDIMMNYLATENAKSKRNEVATLKEQEAAEPDYKKYISIEWLKKYTALCCTFDMNMAAIHFVDTWIKMNEKGCCENKAGIDKGRTVK